MLDRAYAWPREQRRRWPDHADVWALRRDWAREKPRLQRELRAGRFGFGLLDRLRRDDGTEIEFFPARDALVLKALALLLEPRLPISRRGVHVEGHGGAKAAVRRVMRHLRAPGARFVLKTDVASYYASIDHVKLLDRLAAVMPDRNVLNLVGQMLCRVSEGGGLYHEFRRGIPLGCPLSPLLGAFFLGELDARVEATGLFFVRYMDDVVVLAPTRHKLRRAVRIVNQTLAELGLEKAREKTFIGRVEHGFDFLGYHLAPGRLTLARATVERFVERAHRLYEQERGKPEGFPRLGAYVRRWSGWALAGLPGQPIG